MGRGISAFVIALLLAVCEPAAATNFTAEITDDNGKPVASAVVSLFPESKTSMPSAASRLATEKTIDQRNETFIPFVTVIPKGGHVVFANNDQTTHQVYSFSKIKQFEITLKAGESSAPFAFDTTGVAALGCNIHDHMIAYTFVAESPWTALTDENGHVTISGVPPGNYQAQVWHPKFSPGREPPKANVAVSGDTARWQATVKLLAPKMAHSHSGNY